MEAPCRLTPEHDIAAFRSGEAELDRWLRDRALSAEGRTARTYVVVAGSLVVGFHSLAMGGIAREAAVSKARRNAPDPVPVMVLARLAVDLGWERRGIGGGMRRDAILRSLAASEIGGTAALLVHAISERAKDFYLRHDFQVSPADPMMLMLTLKDAAKSL